MNPLWCPHSDTTEADDDGRAICTRCLSVVQTRLTLAVLQAAIDKIAKGR